MTLSSALRLLSLTAAMAAFPALGLAQDQQPAPTDAPTNFGPRAAPQAPQGGQPQPAEQAVPKLEEVGKFGAWSVQCGDVPVDGKGATQRQCGMSQTTKSEKDERIPLTVVVARAKQQGKTLTMMRVLAPMGVYLPGQVGLEVDGAATGRVPFIRCRGQICEAMAEASAPTLDKLKQGKQAVFYIMVAPGVSFPMKMSLEGFGKGLAELDKQNN
ncbi:MAG TPA: invasion associated locus B family protein [Aestuariivirga sp.]|nr:invasion associated locus B family protein [Aestuariivirga sp.]